MVILLFFGHLYDFSAESGLILVLLFHLSHTNENNLLNNDRVYNIQEAFALG